MTEADAPRRPRFPWVALALCLASVGAAAWTWMRYSFAWDTTLADIENNAPAGRQGRWPDLAYVQFEAVMGCFCFVDSGSAIAQCTIRDPGSKLAAAILSLPHAGSRPLPQPGAQITCRGRIHCSEVPIMGMASVRKLIEVDAIGGRFTGASIAGLVVGAWGAFVFTSALIHWRTRRRECAAQIEEARCHGTQGKIREKA